MRIMAMILLTGLGVASQADAQTWEIRTQGPVTIRGEGQLPTLVGPPPVVPPPITPPVVLPPVVPPVRDTTPFVFPTNCRRAGVEWERTKWTWRLPGKRDDAVDARVYAIASGAGNPAGQAHTCAGIIKSGVTAEDGRTNVGDLEIWAPFTAGTEQPWHLRCLLATGRLCP